MIEILKKGLYAFMFLVFLVYIYNSYIKKDTGDSITIREQNEKIKTRNVRYDIGDEYEVEAETQTEDKSSDMTYFTVAKAMFDNLELRGKEAVVDKYNNMVLKGNIIGKSTSGWEIYAQEIKYDDKKGKFHTNTKVKAVNPVEKIEMEADNFEANKDFTVLTFTKNVKINSEDMTLSCNRAIYNRKSQYVKVTENVRFQAKDLVTEKGELKKISAMFNQGIYNMAMGQFTSYGRFTIYYQGYALKGDNLIYFNTTGDVNIYGNVEILKGDMLTKLSKIYYSRDKQKITLTGPILGKKGDYNYKGENGSIDVATESFKILDNVEIYNSETKLKADELEFKDKENKMYLYSNLTSFIELKGDDYRIVSKTAEFDTLKEVIYLPERYKFERELVFLEGENLIFDTKTQKGTSENNVLRRERETLYADFANFDMINRIHVLSGRVRGNYQYYDFNTSEAIINEYQETVEAIKPFFIENKNEKIALSGQEGVYDNKLQEIRINKDAKMLSGDYEIKAKKIRYDIQNESGLAEGKLKLTNEKDNITGTGDRATLKNGKELVVEGMLEYRMNDYVLNTKEAIYVFDEEKVYFDNPGTLVSRQNRTKVEFEKAEYDKRNNISHLHDFRGEREGVRFRSDTADYVGDEKKFVMKGNAKVMRANLLMSSVQFDYYTETGELVSETDLTIVEDNIQIVSKKGKLNTVNKTIEGETVVMTTSRGDRITGDYLFGEFLKKEFNFKGNLQADLVDGISFSGDMAKLYFVENPDIDKDIASVEDLENDRFFLTRGEIKNNAEFNYRDIKLNSEFLEIDLDKKIVFGKGTSILKLDEQTDITADYIYLDVENETGEMENNVKITNKSELTGVINTSADRATLDNKNKKVMLSGNVVSYQGKTKIMAEKGVYDIETKELSGAGNIHLKYNIESEEDKEKAKDEEQKKRLEENEGENIEEINAVDESDETTEPVEESDIKLELEMEKDPQDSKEDDQNIIELE